MLFDDTYGPGYTGDIAWKQVPGFPDGFEVSEFGAVRHRRGSIYRNRKLYSTKEGYLRVSFYRDHKHTSIGVHRLILLAFRPYEEPLEQVDHMNTITWDNRLENLRWVTAAENNKNLLTAEHRRRSMKARVQAGLFAEQNKCMVEAAIAISKRPVICIETERHYESIAAAHRETGISRNAIFTSCATEHTRQTERTTRNGKPIYHFSYAD